MAEKSEEPRSISLRVALTKASVLTFRYYYREAFQDLFLVGTPMGAVWYTSRQPDSFLASFSDGFLKLQLLAFVGIFLSLIVLRSYRNGIEAMHPRSSEALELAASIRNDLMHLTYVLETEAARIEESRRTIQELQIRRSNLEPLLKSEEAVVERILTAHDRVRSRSVWAERAYSFCFGVLASLIASFIYEALK